MIHIDLDNPATYVWLIIYFIPGIIASIRRHRNSVPIGILNFFLGWTIIGWIATLAWAFSKDTKRGEDVMSEKVKHTSGPWIAAPYSSVVGAPVVSASGRPIATVTYFKIGDGFENHDKESAANGRLIAAAPEMLAALRVVAGSDNWRCFVDEEWDIVNDAISKAEGRT